MSLYPLAGTQDLTPDEALRRLFDETVIGKSFASQSNIPALEENPANAGSPLSSLLAPADTANPAMPIPSMQERPGFFGRIKQQPGGSKALIAFGANLLASPNFFEGLGKGAMAYQGTLDEEADKLKPQLTKDGTFTTSRDPVTGEMTFKRTPVADFEEALAQRKLDANLAAAKLRDEGQTLRNTETLNYRDRWANMDDDFRRWKQDQDNNQAQLDRENRIAVAKLKSDADAMLADLKAGLKPPSAGIENLVSNLDKAASTNAGIIQQAVPVIQSLEDGTLNLGAINNLYAKAATQGYAPSTEATRAYGRMTQVVQNLVNGILLDAKGVQTDGDATRAKIMSLVSQGDNVGAARELRTVLGMLQRGQQEYLSQADEIRQRQGMNTRTPTGVPSRSGGSRPTVSNW